MQECFPHFFWNVRDVVTRFYKVTICAIVALLAGMVASACAQAAGAPGIWARPESMWTFALAGAVFYVAVPLITLSVAALFGRTPSTAFSLLVSVGWLTIIFAWWAEKPWGYYGEFPWWGFQRHYVGMLPVSLSLGLAFALCARRVLSPNIAVKNAPFGRSDGAKARRLLPLIVSRHKEKL